MLRVGAREARNPRVLLLGRREVRERHQRRDERPAHIEDRRRVRARVAQPNAEIRRQERKIVARGRFPHGAVLDRVDDAVPVGRRLSRACLIRITPRSKNRVSWLIFPVFNGRARD